MSTETNFTPGPWKHTLRNANAIMTTFHGVQIGRFYIDVSTNNEDADAHLIAAAPELYSALETAVMQGERMLNGEPPEEGQDFDGWFLSAKAALAKARGET